ncbi:hypothetical protein WDM22_38675 [Bradyrhizobium septentrionale]|uniref:hypothetical protein n=1 Tax=Bradyrhizobium septentrionale TaxID=1404411 RepID=UPI0030D16DB9
MSGSRTPYSEASSDIAARDEITKLLRRFGCAQIGFADDYRTGEVLVAFQHRGRRMQLRASAQGWAARYLKEHPYNYRIKRTEAQYRESALSQGQIAVNSILRDWIKGQIMAIETGILSFDAVVMPYMITNDVRTIAERADQLGLLPGSAA